MKNKAALFFSLWLLCISVNVAYADFPPAPTAEEYEKYVENAITLSKQLADSDAAVRELGIFNDLTGKAQSHLAIASDAASTFATLIPYMKDLSTLRQADGSIDVDETLKQYLISTQMLTLHSAIQENLQRYHEISAQLLMGSDKHFDLYSVDHINTTFTKLDVELPDGVFIPLIGYDPYTAAAAIVIDIYQVWQNANEKSRIEAAAKKLEENKVKTPEYQQDARNHYQLFLTAYKPYYAMYDQLAQAYQNLADSMRVDDLRKRHRNIEAHLNQFGANVIAKYDQDARTAVRAKLKDQNDADEALKINIQANLRIKQNLDALPTSSGSQRDGVIENLRADIALSDVMDLAYTKRLIPVVEKAIAKSPSPNFKPTDANEFKVAFHLLISDRARMTNLAPEHATALALAAPDNNEVTGTCVYGNGFAFGSFCNDLFHNGPSSATGIYGTYTNGYGGFTQFDRRPLVNSYNAGGGSPYMFVPPLRNVSGNIDPWGVERTIAALATDIPGQFTLAAERAKSAQKVLDRNLAALGERRDQLNQITKDFNESRSDYLAKTITPSVQNTLARMPQLQQVIDNKMLPVLASGSGAPNTGPVQLPDAGVDVAAPSLRERATVLPTLNNKPLQLWEKLEPVWRVVQLRNGELSVPDRTGIADIYHTYFDRQGLLSKAVLSKEAGNLVDGIEQTLRTDINTVEGRTVRLQIDRGLIAASQSDSDKVQNAYGGLFAVTAADAAYANGDSSDGNMLLKAGVTSIDIALGFVPVAGAVNDAAQIVYGMATGYDYTGHRMHASDYALRSLGIVLNLLPAGSAVVKVAGNALGRAFEQGATIIRGLNIGGKIDGLLSSGKILAVYFVDSLGEWFPAQLAKVIPPEDLAHKVMQLAKPQGVLAQRVGKFVQGGAIEDHVVQIMGWTKNTTRILRGGATDAAFRIPDVLNKAEGFLAEIKTDKVLDLTPQIKDFLRYCSNETPSLQFRLFIMQDTVLKPDLIDALKKAGAVINDITPNGIKLRVLP